MKTSGILVFLVIGTVTALPHYHKTIPVRIGGGTEASKGEFPHIIYINYNGLQYCAGSLINPNYVLTTAWCADNSATGYTLVAGEHNLVSDEGTEQSRNVSQIILHPNWDYPTMTNDVAIMRVSFPFTLNSNVQTVSLPNSSFTPTGNLTVAGWGTGYDGTYVSTLMKVTVPLVSTETCNNSYGGRITSGMLCAGYPGKGSCMGDNGGPLMSGDEHTLVGMASWRYGCGSPQWPGVHTNVIYYSSWIQEQIRK